MTPEELAAVGLQVNVEGAVATVTLDSPHNRNALSRRLVTELLAALERAAADEAGVTPQELADTNHRVIAEDLVSLGCT